MDFVLDRSKWICGKPSVNEYAACMTGIGMTSLLNEEGFMCCLGQFCKQLGLSDAAIRNNSLPPSTAKELWSCTKDSNWDESLSRKCVKINDDQTTPLSVKETLLRECCEEHGHTLTVVGEYPHLADVPVLV